MKIQCTSCATIFFIDDSLIAGKGVKAQCPRCGHQTVVRSNEGTAPPAPPTSGLAYSQGQGQAGTSNTQIPYPAGSVGSSAPQAGSRNQPSSPGTAAPENRSSGFFGEQGGYFGQENAAPYFGGAAPTAPPAYTGPQSASDPLGHYTSSAPVPGPSFVQQNPGALVPPVSHSGILSSYGSPGQPLLSPSSPDPVPNPSPATGASRPGSILGGAFEPKPVDPSASERGRSSLPPEQEATRVQPHPSTPYSSGAPHEDLGRLDPTWIKIRRIADGQEIGPVSLKEVRSLYVHGKISLNDEYAGQDLNWSPIRDNRSLLDILQRTPQLNQRSGKTRSSNSSQGKLWLYVVSFLLFGTVATVGYFYLKPEKNTKDPSTITGLVPTDLLDQWQAQWRKQYPTLKLDPKQSHNLTKQAMTYFAQDQIAGYYKAISLFKQALLTHPKNDRALAGLALSFLWQSSSRTNSKAEHDLQRNQYEVLLRRESQTRQTPILRSTYAAFLNSEPDKALSLVQSVASKSAQDAIVQLISGEIWLSQQQDHNKATTHLQKAIQQDPALARARVLLAGIYTQRSHYYKSTELLEPLLRVRHPEAMYLQAQIHINSGEHNVAKKLLSQLLSHHPWHTKARLLLGIVQYQILQQPAAAQQTLKGFAKLSKMPLSLQLPVLLHRGYIHLINQEYNQAKSRISQLFKLDKNYVPGLFLQIQYFLLQKQYKEAIPVLAQLTARLPSDIQIQTLDALIKENLEQWDAAANLYQQLSDQNTRYIWPRLLLARIHLQKKSVNKALLQIKASLEVEPDYLKNQCQPVSLYIIPRLWQPLVDFFQKTQEGSHSIFVAAAGMVAYQMDKSKQAHTLLRRSLQEDSKGLAANLYMAQYHFDANRLQQAQQHANLVYQMYDQHAIASQLLGLIAIKRRQLQKASSYLNLVRKARPWFISSQVGLALIYHEQGNTNDALEELKPLLDTYHYHHLLTRALLRIKR